MGKKWVLIGISGVTCGGKSSLSKILHDKIPHSIILNQDVYFLEKTNEKLEIIPELNHANWEVFSSLDYASFFAKIVNLTQEEPKKEPGVIIIEGHLLLNFQPLVDILDKKYFFTLSKEDCWNRRRVRTYDPPDPPSYFEMCVWPMYLKHKKEMEENGRAIVYLDGTKSHDITLQLVMEDLKTISIFIE